MKATLKTQTSFEITLSGKEASWLRSIMQNPILLGEKEAPEDTELRKNFFELLDPTRYTDPS